MLVEQLLPAPVRYRLVWHDKGAVTRPIYLWRPVPPLSPLFLPFISPISPPYLPYLWRPVPPSAHS